MNVNGKERYKTMKNWKNVQRCFIDRGATSFSSFLLFWITVRNAKDITMTALKKYVIHCMYQLENKRFQMTKSWQNVFRDKTQLFTPENRELSNKKGPKLPCFPSFLFYPFSYFFTGIHHLLTFLSYSTSSYHIYTQIWKINSLFHYVFRYLFAFLSP